MATRTTTKRKLTDESELPVPTAPLSPAELHDKIAARAYEIFLARHGSAGDSTSDWLMAEHEVCSIFATSISYADNVVPITSVTTKRKQATPAKSIKASKATKPTARRSSTPKAAGQTRTRKSKEEKA
ncbi:MAG TPA: DUF2934 domain-containing protein [Blastocatellia bacterium]|nr:DUF2934 domain-containing protein [Blastocatellia bacterium]